MRRQKLVIRARQHAVTLQRLCSSLTPHGHAVAKRGGAAAIALAAAAAARRAPLQRLTPRAATMDARDPSLTFSGAPLAPLSPLLEGALAVPWVEGSSPKLGVRIEHLLVPRDGELRDVLLELLPGATQVDDDGGGSASLKWLCRTSWRQFPPCCAATLTCGVAGVGGAAGVVWRRVHVPRAAGPGQGRGQGARAAGAPAARHAGGPVPGRAAPEGPAALGQRGEPRQARSQPAPRAAALLRLTASLACGVVAPLWLRRRAQTDKRTPRRVSSLPCPVHEAGYVRVHLHPKRFPAVYQVPDWRQRIIRVTEHYVAVDKPAGVQVRGWGWGRRAALLLGARALGQHLARSP